jgi:hypothetical protein
MLIYLFISCTSYIVHITLYLCSIFVETRVYIRVYCAVTCCMELSSVYRPCVVHLRIFCISCPLLTFMSWMPCTSADHSVSLYPGYCGLHSTFLFLIIYLKRSVWSVLNCIYSDIFLMHISEYFLRFFQSQ